MLPSTPYLLTRTRAPVLGFTRCSGTPILLSSPNDLTNTGVWSPSNITAAFGVSAPDNTSTATSLTVNADGASESTNCTQFIPNIAANTQTSLQFYLKMAAGASPWVAISMSDFVANAADIWFNLNTGTVGTSNWIGTITLNCIKISPVTGGGGGWYVCSTGFISAGASYSGTMRFIICPVISDNSATTHVADGQVVHAWQVGA